MLIRKGLTAVAVLAVATTSATLQAGTGSALVGWQTFETCTVGANNSGICDDTPDTNSTYDDTPVGSIGPNNAYLGSSIGPNASILGRDGFGQNTNNTFMNGPNFGGNDLMNEAAEGIEDWPLADGSPGARIGPQGGTGTSSWKFAESTAQRLGDISITNYSDYYFRLEFIHFDGRIGNVNAAADLDLVYLSGNAANDDGFEMIKASTGVELVNLVGLYNTENATLHDFETAPDTINISRSVGGAIDSAAYIAPGKTASFRFRWTGALTTAAESQLDNIAFEGTFFQTSALMNTIDPVAVEGGAVNIPVLPVIFQYLFALILGVVSASSLARMSEAGKA